MSKVKRVYVEKKPDYAVKAKELHEEIKNYLGIKAEYVRVLVRYDIENISDETYAKALETVFAEPPVDVIYEGEPELAATDKVFSVEALPGQFDQRADSAEQCVKLLAEDEEPVIKTATTYVLSGDVTDEQMKAVMDYCVNPVDSRICGMEIPETLVTEFPEPADVHIFDGFKDMAEADLKELYDSLGLAMTFKDFLHIQNYFKGEEKRDPSMTEIRVLDTYWSDHCRHTTFSTELTDVEFDDGDYKDLLEKTFDAYRAEMKKMYKGEHADMYTVQFAPEEELDEAALKVWKEGQKALDAYAFTDHVLAPTPDKITALGMARTFQNIRLWKTQTVFDNVLIAKHMRRSSNMFSATFRGNRKEEAQQRAEVLELLKVVGLEDVQNELATSLPYGKQRRLEIARALATDPTLLLLDEPAAGMNPQETLELAEFIKEIRDHFHKTILLIEHHMDLVMGIADRIYVLDFGKLIAKGTPEEIQNNERVIDAYLGVAEDAED